MPRIRGWKSLLRFFVEAYRAWKALLHFGSSPIRGRKKVLFNVEERTVWDNFKMGGSFGFLGGYHAILSLLLFGVFVTCMTGNVTDTGIALGLFDYHEFLAFLFVYLSFIGGGFVSAKIFDNFAHVPVLLLEASLLFLIGENIIPMPFIAFLAAFAMGLQNGLTTCASWNLGKVRTTHVTGTSTDTGIAIGNRDKEKLKFTSFMLSCYLIGCLVAFFTAPVLQYRAFTIGAIFVVATLGWDMLSNLLKRNQQAVVKG